VTVLEIAPMVLAPRKVVGRCLVCDCRLVTPREAVRCEPCQERGAWPPWMAAELEAVVAEPADEGSEAP